MPQTGQLVQWPYRTSGGDARHLEPANPASAARSPPMPLDLSGATIVFDLDGTLVDTAPDLTAAANHVFGLIGLAPISPAELRPLIGRGSRAMIEQGLRLHGVSKSPDEVSAVHELFFPYYAVNLAVLWRQCAVVPAG